jgi:myo-inositol-1(or 4)-monophosphatase
MRELLDTALAAAEAAAQVHRRWAGRIRTEEAAEKTTNSDFVTKVDMEAQAAAVNRIREAFPRHPILAEEDDEGARNRAAEEERLPIWVVDPLDGTTNFLHGHPFFASSVGVVLNGRPMAGAVVSASSGERWWAAADQGAYRNGERIVVSRTRELRYALVGTGFPFKLLDRLPEYLEQFGRVLPATAGIRRGGSAALDMCHLAQGSLDAFWELWLAPWDIAAGLCILEEAGGVARRVEGGPLDLLSAGSVLAANSPGLLDALGEKVTPAAAESRAGDGG